MNTANIRDFITAHPEIVYYQDVHSYTQLIMWPYGYTEQDAADDAHLRALCDAGNAALFAVHNETYECGSLIDILYGASGVGIDFVYDKTPVINSYTFESRPKTGAEGGFAPDPSQILPNAQEIWAFHQVIADQMKAP